jgi:tetratricopeptide (TPR) repeat protein
LSAETPPPGAAPDLQTLPLAEALRLAVAHMRAGDNDKAELVLTEILNQRPQTPDALNLPGLTRHAGGRTEEGLALVERAIALNETAAYQASLGRLLMAAGRTEAGLAALNRALALDPGQPEVLQTLGAARIRTGDMAGAEATYREGVAGAPQDVELLFGHAYTLAESGATQAAAEQYRRLLTIDPLHVQAHTNLAALLLLAGDFDGAVRHFRDASDVGPDSAYALYNLGRALDARGDHTQTIDCYDGALAIEPNLAAAHSNAGTGLQRLGQQAEALERFDRAFAINPDYPAARFNRSVSLLSLGRFAEGWVDYEWRFRVESLAGRIGARAFGHPRGAAGPLMGQRLLAWSEQGPGDAIMFASMVPDIISFGAEVIVECDAPLVPIFARSFAAATVVARSDPPDPVTADRTIAAEAPLGGVGRLLRPELASFPEGAGYLTPDSLREQACHARYATLRPGVKIGIAWRLGDDGLALADLDPVLTRPGLTVINLEGDIAAEEVSAFHTRTRVATFTDPTIDPASDFDGLAAQLASLDLVIAAAGPVAHLAGALGKPTLVLAPRAADWCWLAEGDLCPWYPSVRVVRQASTGDWSAAIAGIAAALG